MEDVFIGAERFYFLYYQAVVPMRQRMRLGDLPDYCSIWDSSNKELNQSLELLCERKVKIR